MVASTAWQLTRLKRDYLEFSIPIGRNIVYQRISTSVIVRAAFKVGRSRGDVHVRNGNAPQNDQLETKAGSRFPLCAQLT